MIRSVRSATAAAVLATAAAVLLGACGSGSGGGTDDRSAGPPAATSAQQPQPVAGPTREAAAPDPVPGGPKVPQADLTPPGGGTFSPNQKEYLADRVPRGTDPVAVLEGGKEICDRLTRTARLDRDAAVSAVVTGEIADPQAAVTHLCPGQQGILDAAAHGFADGAHVVGARPVAEKTVAPGRYRAPHPSTTCQWHVTGGDGRDLGHGTGPTLTVPAGARQVSSTGCYAWLSAGGTG